MHTLDLHQISFIYTFIYLFKIIYLCIYLFTVNPSYNDSSYSFIYSQPSVLRSEIMFYGSADAPS